MDLIFLIHLFSTLFMCGLCWFVQIVHYPLFRAIRPEDFPAYERRNFVTGYVTVPVMTLELFSGLWYLYTDHNKLFLYNMLALALIWTSTFIFQVPLHLKLTREGDPRTIDRLIHTNWIRTLAWTVRSVLLGYLMVRII